MDEQPPIACTLDADALPERVSTWEALLAQVTAREAIDGGVRLQFPSGHDLAGDVARLASAEQACCAFFDFTLHIAATGTSLDVRAPAAAQEIVESLFGG